MAKVADGRKRLFGRDARQVGAFAMIQPSRAKVSSAALRKVEDGALKVQPLGNRWAAEAYQYADEIGEVGFVMNLSANMAAQCATRTLFIPVDPAKRGICECKLTEVVVTDEDGYAWTNPAEGEGECRGCVHGRMTGAPCPFHGRVADRGWAGAFR